MELIRPRMLKDCLLEDSNSCSSSGFKSFPRRHPLDPFPIIPKRKQTNPLQAVINAVKILPRSLSRRLLSKNKAESQASITVFRVKDIVRWSSSKDLHDRMEPSPPHLYTAKTMTTITGSSTTSATSCSSWCDSDFTSEFLPSSWGSNVEECGEKETGERRLQCVGEDSCTAISVSVADTEVGPEFESEHNSPISVFEIQHEEDDEASDASFTQCLDNVERTKQKLMQTIQRFETLANITPFNLEEWGSTDEESCIEGGRETEEEDADEIEEKASQLWNRVKERHAIWIHEEHLLMDFFRDELMHRTYIDQDFEEHLVGEANGWLQGQRPSELECGTGEQRRLACVREIEKRNCNEERMKEEHEEVAVQIEDGIFTLLMNETLSSLYQC